jgi:hypothetical protein
MPGSELLDKHRGTLGLLEALVSNKPRAIHVGGVDAVCGAVGWDVWPDRVRLWTSVV